ncbi:MAG TPA: biotin--[acetyl-CoA-carboxylase] ligase [Solirubrobacterales bacterium]|nr:biotin--[acetyl-CoA-carboxylase] ligase [Solirubrobacterales bacterium]
MPRAMVSFGSPHRHFRRTDSTNERAKDLALAGAPGGLVITAAEQTAGRGRRGNEWFAPAGSCLLYSALLRPFAADDAPPLPLAVPVAVCEAAESVAPVRCQVKWPNDVWIDERKVAGVLVEARPDEGWAVIGVGVNVAIPQDDFPADLREAAVSLLPTEAEGGLPPGGAAGVRRALTALNESLGRWSSASGDEVLAAFRARDALAGKRISWGDGEGTAAEIDERGHLVVEKDDGERVALGAGEVHLAVER